MTRTATASSNQARIDLIIAELLSSTESPAQTVASLDAAAKHSDPCKVSPDPTLLNDLRRHDRQVLATPVAYG